MPATPAVAAATQAVRPTHEQHDDRWTHIGHTRNTKLNRRIIFILAHDQGPAEILRGGGLVLTEQGLSL